MKKLSMMLGILLLSSLSFSQIVTQNITTFTTALQAPVIVNNIGSGAHFYKFTWNVTGTVSACTIALDSSPDGTTWTAGGIIAGQACTTNGTFTSGSVTFNYYRVNPNASITGTGSVTMNTSGYATNPASGTGGGCIATVATLVATCGTTAGTIASVTDGSIGSDCTVGGGTNKNACIYTGSAWAFAGSAAGAPAFSAIITGTNTTPLVIGTGGSLTVSGSGTVNATNINGTSLAGLATCLVKNTTATGVPVCATANTDYTTPSGNITGTSGGLTGTPNITVGTITPTTIAGGAFSGTFTGAPTFSGNIIFSGTPVFNNTLALNTTGTSGGLTGSPAITVSSCSGCAGGAPAWNTNTNPAGNLSLAMGTNTSIFGTTTAVAGLFQFNNSTAATITTPQSSPTIQLGGTEFHAAASTPGSVSLQFVPGVGTDAVSTFNISHVGSATGAMTLQNSGPVAAGSDGVHPSYFTMIGNTTQPTVPANTVGFMGPVSASFTGYSCQFPVTAPSGTFLQCATPSSGISTGTWVAPFITSLTTTGTSGAASVVSGVLNIPQYTGGGSSAFPITVTGGVSGGIPYFSSTTVESASPILNTNILTKGGGTGNPPTNSLWTDDGTTATYTGTGGTKSPVFTATGTTAGFVDYPQGTTSSAVSPCNVATSICEQAPTAVTSYLVNKPGVAAGGTLIGTNTSSVITQGFSGDTNHSATVTTGSGTSIGSTSLCSTTFCPVGTYRVNVYIDITTACGTTGSYTINLIYTDDQGSKTVPINLEGTGSVPATGVLTTTSTANFGYDSFILRSTGSASINYSTTAVACGTAGPMVGKLYLSVEPLM